MAMLQFPADTAVGEVWCEGAREPGGSGHRLAIGVVQVPDGTAARRTRGLTAPMFRFAAIFREFAISEGCAARNRRVDVQST
jgi:hypothetical protein